MMAFIQNRENCLDFEISQVISRPVCAMKLNNLDRRLL